MADETREQSILCSGGGRLPSIDPVDDCKRHVAEHVINRRTRHRAVATQHASSQPSTHGCDRGRHATESTFHASGNSLPQKTQTKSSSRTMLHS
ncbi:hypothetical protein [Streptomyces sp. NPDC002463]|uniref:hypothetical protein n=1 Tax=Streptomyces sp. NPDC002463 TaxID=3364645 RepID=UPI0036B62641